MPSSSSATGSPIQVGPWMPLVMPRIGRSIIPDHVSLAVWACRWLTALAPLVRRSEKAVMSNWRGVRVDAEPELEDALDRDAAVVQQRAGHPPDEVRIEAFVAGRDGGVDGEHAVRAHVVPGLVELPAGGDVLARALGQEERRVALVEMPDRRRQAECPDRAHAADAEHELLVEPHLAAANVQDVRDRPVRVGVLREIGVEQQDRDPSDLGDPDRDRQVAPGQLDRHGQRQPRRVLDPSERQARQVVVGVVVLLVAVGVDRLAEVALAIEEADADRRQGHVAGRLHVVAGEHAEPARVDAERFVEPVLGAEIGDRSGQLVGVPALEPVAGAVGHVAVELGEDIVVFGQELGVIEQARPLGRAADDRDRVPVAGPGRAVDRVEQPAGPRMPRPVKVVGEASKAFEPGRQGKRGRRDRGHADWVHEGA